MSASVYRAAVVVALAQLFALSASAFECPIPQPLAQPGVLKETSAQINRLSNLLASGDDENRIVVTVDDLRARYPGIENAEIVNYLIAADCPVVAKIDGLGEQGKQARLDRFGSIAAKIVYQGSH
jgi:hypothetical protein